jgi:hypothetical protein
MDQPPPISAPPPLPQMTLPGRMLNVMATPGEVFESLKVARSSAANWLLPVLLYGIVASLSFFFIFSQPAVIQKATEPQAKALDEKVKAGTMSQADADKALAMMPLMMKAGSAITGFIASAIEVFWWALVLWLIARFAFKSEVDFVKWLEVSGLASIICVLDVVMRTLLAITLSNPAASLSASVFLNHPDPQSKTFMLLSLVNIMTFWVIVVRFIGLAKLTDVSLSRAAAWVFGVWVAMMFVLVSLSLAIQALVGQMKAGH